ncbi:Receptor-type guanylate cyclase gcy [Seminavis robusta]|uniref:Receptor-type guanylate cyclase gcy n=1 Tax=Seminavis robusta TaxID=568900 RepID=A0A9N8E4F6_9STRA|nr:Receptor-type guanylate cyclase gcy [Seminavis robusta]|eukprot:Sro512_g157580.1 Receptor-type guanylate cyclase gcy (1258) ;mRNA; r:6199-11940
MTISSPNNNPATTSEAAQQRLEEDLFLDENKASDEDSDDGDDDIDSDEESSQTSSRYSRSKSSTGEPSSSGAQEAREKQEIENLIRRETKSVMTWRETVTGILMIVGFISGLAAFVFLGREEHMAFETAFEEATLIIANKYIADTQATTSDTKVLSDLVTANAIGTNSTWPFVTIPFFEVYGRNIRSAPTSDMVISAPLVSEEERAAWEDYTTKNHGWILEGNNISATPDLQTIHDDQLKGRSSSADTHNGTIIPYIHIGLTDEGVQPVPAGQGPYCPVWQVSPPPADNAHIVNLDLFSYPEVANLYSRVAITEISMDEVHPVISTILNLGDQGAPLDKDLLTSETNHHRPRSVMMAPVTDRILNHNQPRPVGLVAISFIWDAVFTDTLPEQTVGIQVTVRNSCDEENPFTYLLNGSNATYMGLGEHVIDNFYETMETVVVSPYFNTTEFGGCAYSLHIQPTRALRRGQNSDEKVIFTMAVLGLFVVIGIVFLFYDRSVQMRNEKMIKQAAKSNRIVSSLFPSTVKKRLFEGDDNNDNGGALDVTGVHSSKPLADFFPAATVLFADIVGFTAWSSVREPSQVFVLLETIYTAYDTIAKRRRIFKIETVGDCYVAAAGLPEPRTDHAPAVARFAHECQTKMDELTTQMEETLGPDTGDLSMRIGIHSGPVTAGVLRGERSRFQLFGDTVNTTARLESTGKPGRIHCSLETAKLLQQMGKGKWLTPREDKVVAKGKGALTTFWVCVKGRDTTGSSVASSTGRSDQSERQVRFAGQGLPHSDSRLQNGLSTKSTRLVNWNVEILVRLLKQIAVRRNSTKSSLFPSFGINEEQLDQQLRAGKMVSDEVVEVITLPKFNAAAAGSSEGSNVELKDEVLNQLRELVTAIAKSYKDKNSFHNFEHASHVTMSVSKLLSRIIAPKLDAISSRGAFDNHEKMLHDHTYGITSDPLTQFACIFSALVHDAEHDGVPNTQLVKEGTELAARYQNQSVAEQNSVDVAWNLLMEPRFSDLRAAIYGDEEEMTHFRKLVVNCVMATDISDKRLKELRNKRWDRAFAGKSRISEAEEEKTEIGSDEEDVNRKATIVIEHLLQASDVSHTMQHWHVFRKWNENLFMEMYTAFREGRSLQSPEVFWYKGEIGFFDFYVIPLAKKLSQCGVFGVSSDEYLNYAESNRSEWEARGQEVVKELAARAKARYEELYGGPTDNAMPILVEEGSELREIAPITKAPSLKAQPAEERVPDKAPLKIQPAEEAVPDDCSIEV